MAVLIPATRACFRFGRAERFSNPHYGVGFIPRTAQNVDSIAEFFGEYATERLITIIRNPAGGFVYRRATPKRALNATPTSKKRCISRLVNASRQMTSSGSLLQVLDARLNDAITSAFKIPLDISLGAAG